MPKRSSGCFECRDRKVRCDGTRPICNTCVRRGSVCPGYRPRQSFVLHTFDDANKRAGLVREDENVYKYANLSRRQAPLTHHQPQAPVGTLLPRPLSPVAIERVHHLGDFLTTYLPRWQGQDLTPPSALILSLGYKASFHPLFSAALDALSAAQLAVCNKHDGSLVIRCQSLYDIAIIRMRRAIARYDSWHGDECLLAIYLLALYEIFVGITEGRGFFFHVQGLLSILKVRGPSSIHSSSSIDVFHGIRYYSLSIGFHVRKASMLDSADWLQVTADAAKTSPWSALMDLCIRIPRLLERSDRKTKFGSVGDDFDNIIDDSQLLTDQLRAWLVQYQKDGLLYEKVSIDSIDGVARICDDYLFDPVFKFKDFAASVTYFLYWMSMLIMRSNSFLLVRQHRQPSIQELTAWDIELSSYADCLCRSVPYSCQPAAGFSGRFSTITPLVLAKKFYESKKAVDQAEWCTKAFFGTKVPGLYTPPMPIDPSKGILEQMQFSKNYV